MNLTYLVGLSCSFAREGHKYVPPQRVGFLRCFGLKTGIDFAHFGLKSGMVFFEGTTGAYERN